MDEISYGPDALEEAKRRILDDPDDSAGKRFLLARQKAKPEEKWPWPLRR